MNRAKNTGLVLCGLVLILMLEVHLRITSSYVEYCLSAVLILMSAAWGAAQKKKRLQPKNRIT